MISFDFDPFDFLKHNETAYLVPPGDVEALADAIAVVANDEGLRVKLGKNARMEVVAKYTWKQHVEKILDFIKGE